MNEHIFFYNLPTHPNIPNSTTIRPLFTASRPPHEPSSNTPLLVLALGAEVGKRSLEASGCSGGKGEREMRRSSLENGGKKKGRETQRISSLMKLTV